MIRLLSILTFALGVATLTYGQNQSATIIIEKTEDGNTTVIEKEIDIESGQDINSILQELGVLDDLGNLQEGQSFEINVKKKDGLDLEKDIHIEYFDMPDFEFEMNESRAFFGVMLSENTNGTGAYINEVIEGTKAEEAEMQVGDVITSINGESFENVSAFVNKVSSLSPGDVIEIEFIRNNETLTKSVELGEKKDSPFMLREFSEDFEFPNTDEDGMRIFEFHMDDEDPNIWMEDVEESAFLGVSPMNDCSDEAGVKIGNVTSESAAEKMGVQQGDRILQINGEEVSSFPGLADMIRNMKPGDEVKIQLLRDGKKMKLKGELGSRKSHTPPNGFHMFKSLPGDEDDQMLRFEFDGEQMEIDMKELEEEILFKLQESMDSMQLFLDSEEGQNRFFFDNDESVEEIRLVITVESITEEDIEEVNKNAEVPLRLEDDLEFEFVNFFPNPGNGEFNLQFQLADKSAYRILVFNQTGQTVFEDAGNTDGVYKNAVDLSAMADGPYYLQIIQGDKTYSKKIIKE